MHGRVRAQRAQCVWLNEFSWNHITVRASRMGPSSKRDLRCRVYLEFDTVVADRGLKLHITVAVLP